MFCKKCGTLYNPKEGPCPKCSTEEIEYEAREMSNEEANKLRKKSWLQLLIGIPAFIGFIYLVIYLMNSFKA